MSMLAKKIVTRVDYNTKQRYHSYQQKRRIFTQYSHLLTISLQQSSSTQGKHQSECKVYIQEDRNDK